MNEMTVIHEYDLFEMPKRKLLKLFHQGAKIYQICCYKKCDRYDEYQPILSDKELMTYCLRCGKKIVMYGVEQKT